MLLGIASMLSQLTSTENDILSHTNKDNKIKNIILSFMVVTSNVTHKDSSNKNRSETICRHPHRLKGIHSRSETSRTGAEGLSFYYPRLLHSLTQMLAVVLLSQHRVSSSKTVRPRAPCGARCIGYTVSTWSAVCSEAILAIWCCNRNN